MDLGLAGKRALVLGASRGLGFACAAALAGEDAEVTIVSRNRASLEEACARMEAQTSRHHSFVAADVASPDGRAAILRACPSPDILVTNAGGPPSGDFRTLSLAAWSSALDLNFLAAVELIRQTIDPMIERGYGRIVNITSMTVRMPVDNLDLSNATRLALTGYVAGVARQVAKHNVTINNLLPGTILTERIRQLGDTAERLIAKVPAGRAGKPEEFGAACAFLCSDQAGFITGQSLLIDGGLCPITI